MDISFFFKPKSVAVFGASDNKMKGGYRILESLVLNHYDGKIFPINPKGGIAFDIPFYRSIEEIEEEIDLGIFFVPNQYIPELIAQCVKKGIKGAIIEAAGFEEVGEEGKKLVEQIRSITDNFKKFRIIGPNCTGISYFEDYLKGFASSFVVHTKYKVGNIAIISQSGMMNGGYFLNMATSNPEMGFRYASSIGNKMDVNENDLIEYIMKDEKVKVLMLYLESSSNAKRLIELIKDAQIQYGKRVVLLRGGVSGLGKQAVASHTGSIAEDSRLITAVLKQSGAILVEDFYELSLVSKTLSILMEHDLKLPEKQKLAIVTGSGGAGTIISDLCQELGIEMPILKNEIYKKIAELYPEWMPPNLFALVDIWPAIEKARGNTEIGLTAADYLFEQEDIQMVIVMVFCSETWPFSIRNLAKLVKKHKKPIFAFHFGDATMMTDEKNRLEKNGIPTFYSEKQLIQTFYKITESNMRIKRMRAEKT